MARVVRRVRINHAGCFNVCEHGPVMVIYPDSVRYRYQTDRDIEEIFRSHVLTRRPAERLRLDIDPTTLHA